MKLIVSIIVAFSCSVNAQGVKPKPTPPPGPLLQKRAPEFSAWSVTIKTPQSANQAEGEPNSPGGKEKYAQKTTLIKTRDVIHVAISDGQQRTWNIWVKDGRQVLVWPDGHQLGFAAPTTSSSDYNPFYVDLAESDFPGFNWISADNFREVKTVLGKKCLIFAIDNEGNVSNKGISRKETAVVDFDTRLPVALSSQIGLIVYDFLTPPENVLAIPPAVSSFIEKDKAKAQSLQRKQSVPF